MKKLRTWYTRTRDRDSRRFAPWRKFRQCEEARQVALAYGHSVARSRDPGERVSEFLELGTVTPVFRVGALVARSIAERGAPHLFVGVKNGLLQLPELRANVDGQDSETLTNPMVQRITGTDEKYLAANGILPLLFQHNKAEAVLFSSETMYEEPPAEELSASTTKRSFPLSLLANDLGHSARWVARTLIGGNHSCDEIKESIRKELAPYVLSSAKANPTPAAKARSPFQRIDVSVSLDEASQRHQIELVFVPLEQVQAIEITLIESQNSPQQPVSEP